MRDGVASIRDWREAEEHVAQRLRTLGWQVEHARTGQHGHDLIASKQPGPQRLRISVKFSARGREWRLGALTKRGRPTDPDFHLLVAGDATVHVAHAGWLEAAAWAQHQQYLLNKPDAKETYGKKAKLPVLDAMQAREAWHLLDTGPSTHPPDERLLTVGRASAAGGRHRR
jgi:hypothetical protein